MSGLGGEPSVQLTVQNIREFFICQFAMPEAPVNIARAWYRLDSRVKWSPCAAEARRQSRRIATALEAVSYYGPGNETAVRELAYGCVALDIPVDIGLGFLQRYANHLGV